jgi:hypothetical protein
LAEKQKSRESGGFVGSSRAIPSLHCACRYRLAIGALVLDENLAPRHFPGLATIAITLALIDRRLARAIEKRLTR